MFRTSKGEGQKNLIIPKKECSTSFETGCKPVFFFFLGLANTFLTSLETGLRLVLFSYFLSFCLFAFFTNFLSSLVLTFYFFVSFSLCLSFWLSFCHSFVLSSLLTYTYLLSCRTLSFLFFLYFYHCYFALSPTQGALKKTFSLSLHSNIFPNDLVQSPPHNSVWMVLCAHARLSFLCLSPPTTTGTIQLSISQIFL